VVGRPVQRPGEPCRDGDHLVDRLGRAQHREGKMAVLRERLIAKGVAPARADAVRCPAGLEIGAITPEEIALSVLADIVRERRLRARDSGPEQAPLGK
jgi:hypothetical protein